MTLTHSAPLSVLRRAAFPGQWWLALLLFVLPGLASAQVYTPPGNVSYVPTVQAGTPFTISFNGIPADAQYTMCWEGENPSGPCDTFGNPGGQTPVVVLTHVYLVPGRPFPIISEVQPNANRNAQILADVTVTSPPPVLTVTPANVSLQQTVVADARPLDPNLTYTLDWGDGLTDTINGVTEIRNEHSYVRADTYVVTLSAPEITPVVATVRVTPPVPTLSATASGLSATLSLGNLVGDYQYSIDWGDGSTETLTAQGDPNVQLVHPYLQPGTYTIQVTPRNGMPVTTTVTVTLPPPTVAATANVLTATLNLGNLVQNSTYSVNWGDSAAEPLTASDVTAQLTHTYSQPGTFTIQVTPQGGIPVTTTVTLTVPGALLSVLPASAPIRQTVTANLSELSSTLTYTLDWGDNTTDTITGTATSQKTHSYSTPGTYAVTLTSPGTTPVIATVTITVPAPTSTAVSSGLSATLNLSNLLTGYIYSVAWGDGTTEALTPTAATTQLTHTYSQPGTVTIQVTPQGSTPVTTTATLTAPNSVLTVTPSSAAIRQAVTANLTSLVPAVTYTLDWGDNTTDTITGTATSQKTHTYSAPGTYTVTLTSSATTPATATVTTTVPAPTATATSAVLTATLNLSNLLTGYTYSVAWGDGTTETLTPTAATAQLTHTYTQPGTVTIQVTPQGGTPVTTTATLTAPNSVLTVTPSSAAIRQAVTANLTSLVPALTYTLDWGDNTTDTITGTATTQKTHVYAQPGTYTVTLTSSATTPATATVTTTVPAPTVTATSTVLTATLNLSNLLTGYAYSVAWGDGTTEALTPTAATAQLTHTYTQPGTVTIQVTPQGSTPVTTTATLTAPNSVLTVTPSSAAIRQAVTANLTSLVPALTYTLDWGDSTTDTITGTATSQKTHTYSAPGTYTVTLTSSATTPAIATVTTSVPAPTPIATSALLTATLNLSNLLTGYAYSVAWGDGTTEALTPTVVTAQLTHTYSQPGSFTIQVTPQGGTPVTTTATLTAPNSVLTVTPSSAAIRQTVTANLISLVPALTYTLDWGDNTTDTITGTATSQKTHTYSAPGTYTVRLSATGTTPATVSVVVGVPAPTATATSAVLTATLNLSNLLTGYAYSVAWGDGTTEALTPTAVTAQLTHTYTQPGTVTIQVTPQGSTPVTTTATLTAPNSVLTVTPSSAAIRQAVTANLTSLVPALTYTLDWGDNTTDTITGTATSQKTHTYSAPGTYTVTLTSSATTPVTATVTITVPAPTSTAVSSGLTATLNLSNLLTGYAYTVAWGDGTTEALTPTAVTAQLTHTYSQPGTVTIQVTPQSSNPVTTTVTLTAPNPVLTVAPSSAVIRQTVTANLTSLVPTLTYTLDWGDNTTDSITGTTTTQKTHVYAQPGTYTVTLTSSATTPATATVTITVPAPTSTAVSSGLSATLNLSNLLTGYTYSVAWGDGTTEALTPTAVTAQLTHTYSQPGTVTIQVTPQGSTPVTTPITLTAPNSVLTVTPSSAAIRQTVTANLTSLVPALTYTLNWGDNTTDSITGTATSQKTHTYSAPGTYTVTLTSSATTPATATVTTTVPPPTVTAASAVLMATLNLSNLLTGYAYSVAWGDGTTETLTPTAVTAQLTHTYTQPGSFTIQVTPQGGTPVTTTATLSLPAATLAVTAQRLEAVADLAQLVSGQPYVLKWGDGATENFTATGTTARLTHQYAQPGAVTLTLTAPSMTPATAALRLSAPPALEVAGTDLTVNASVSQLVVGLTYTLSWGDGRTEQLVAAAAQVSRTYSYARPGTYTVRVSLTGGESASAAVTVVAPVAALSITPTTAALGQPVTALLSGLAPSLTYSLDWGDGNPSEPVTGVTTAGLTHVFVRFGTYLTGTFTVTLKAPGVTPVSGTVTVGVPVPTLSTTQDLLKVTLSVGNLVLIPSSLYAYSVDWGDGSSESFVSSGNELPVQLVHNYPRPGTFRVQVTAPGSVTPVGTSVTLTVPDAALSVTPPSAPVGQPMTARITGMVPGLTYTLSWGDGTNETLTGSVTAERTHAYAEAGTRAVYLETPGTTTISVSITTTVLTPTATATANLLTATLSLGNLVPGYEYLLDWGDGVKENLTAAAETAQRTHTYARAITVAITVTPVSATPVSVTVTLSAPIPVLNVTPSTVLLGETVTADLSNLPPGVSTLDWGDGQTEFLERLTATQRTHTYNTLGVFTVTLNSTAQQKVTVTAPAPLLAVTPTSLSVRGEVTARLSRLVAALTYTLNWGDGTTDSVTGRGSVQKTHAYSAPGTYTIMLGAPQTEAVSATVTATIPAPTVKVTEGFLTVNLALERLLSGDLYTITWGDGSTETLTPTGDTAQLTHTYTQPGTFTVQVARSGVAPVTVTARVVAPFPILVVTPEDAQAGQTVTADLTNLVPALSYTLNWDDGTTESVTGVTTARLTHVYLRTGIFSVRTDQAQGYISRGYLVTVTAPMPAAALTVSTDRLNAAASLTKLIPVLTYTLDWGDGTPAVTVTGVTEAVLTHRYTAVGDYSLLFYADGIPGGVRETASVQVPAGTLTLSAQGLEATARFSGLEAALSYTLNWGDGTTTPITLQEPGTGAGQLTHTYTLPGTYTVSLTSPRVGTASAPVTLTVQAPVLEVTAPTLTATARLSGLLPAAKYTLEWGDGAGEEITGQSAATLTHEYLGPGVRTVRVTARSIPEATSEVRVGVPPTEAVRVLNVDDLGAGYHFQASGLLPEAVYFIDYGDGQSERLTGSKDVRLDHTYARSGLYVVTLRLLGRGEPDTVRVTTPVQVQIELSFRGGLLIFTQPDRTTDLRLNSLDPFSAAVTVNYRGSGRLSGRWLVDGQPYKSVDEVLPEGSSTLTLSLSLTERRVGSHTLGFEFSDSARTAASPTSLSPIQYALNVPQTVSFGGFDVKLVTVENLGAQSQPGSGTLTLSGSGTLALVVGATPVGDVTVSFKNQTMQLSDGNRRGVVYQGDPVTVALNDQPVRNARLGDAALRLSQLKLDRNGATLRGTVTLPAVSGGTSLTLNLTDAPLAATSGDLLGTLRPTTAIQNVALPEAGLTLAADEVTLDLSAAQNSSALAEAYQDQAPQPNDWMGLVFPAARLTVGTPILRQAVTLTKSVAYNLSGYVTTIDLAAGSTGMLGWTVDLTSLHSSVLAGRISTTKGVGSVLLPLVNERMNVTLGWNTNAQPGARFTLSGNGTVKEHSFGKTSLNLGEGAWTVSSEGAANVVFSNALWKLNNVGRDAALNTTDLSLPNLTMTGSGDVSLDGRPWSSVTGKTNLTVFGYPFAAAEVGVQRQGSGYTLGLNGRLQVNEKLPVNNTNSPLLFWVEGGRDVKVTTERIRLTGEVVKVPFDITLDGAFTTEGRLEFSGDGKMNMAGLLDVNAKALFGRFNGTNFNYFSSGSAGSVGYGSVLASIGTGAQIGKPLVTVKRVELYELQGGLLVNMDWPGGLDQPPRFREGGPNMVFQAGALLSVKQDKNPPIKPFMKGVLNVDTTGGFDMKADLWLLKPGQALVQTAPNGRALVSVSGLVSLPSSSRLLVQACVGPNGISSVGGLNCAGAAELNLYDLMKLRGSLELYAPFSGDDQHLYVGTKESPIVVNLPRVPEARGYLMIDRDSVKVGAGVTWSFEKGDSGSLLVCRWNWNIKASASLDAEFGITYVPVALDGSVKFGASASASAGGCGLNVNVGATMTFDGKLHLASDARYFDGKVAASVSLPVIPDINFSVNTKVNF